MKNFTLLTLTFLFFACGTMNNPYLSRTATHSPNQKSETPLHSLYLIGDTGAADGDGSNYVLPALQTILEQENKNASIAFLGDQLYQNGMPKKEHEDRALAEQILTKQLDILDDFPGKAFFIPGERDWANGHDGGRKALLRQEKFLENYFDEGKKVHMYPGHGCGDPKVIKITKDLVFVFLDTQWWLQNWSDAESINQGCDIKTRFDLVTSIQEIFTEHKNDEVVVMMHHPMVSNGIHGGRFGVKEHLMPFSEPWNVNIPLPIVGSLVPLFRNIQGGRQDIVNERYQELMQEMEAVARKVGVHAIFASAHDNSLQHFSDYKLQHIISGSGARTNHAGKGGTASFAQEARGFCKIAFYEEFETWLEIYTVAEAGAAPQLVYNTQIRAPRAGTVEEDQVFPPVTQTDITLPANSGFEAGGVKKFFLGDQYRDIWTTPVQAPIVNLESELGGLTPIKKGGGMSSNSLRMEIDNGRQYILRSINKDYRKLVPPNFSNLKLINVFQDQNSASHPYGALVIPRLSQAAGVYYTSPRLVFLEHQRGLGNYNSQFPEELYLLEQRPSGDWSNAEQFGFSEEIVGYTDLLANLREKKSHYVDQEWVCKSRMFDILIHDWDRHDDQWRWASFEQDDGRTMYRPIPRDRDQAFYKFRGVVPGWIAAFMVKKFKTMKDDVRDTKNQSFNARYFDRYFMNSLEWEDWETVIKELQASVTDEAIDEAMNDFPEETQGENDEHIGELLRARRGNLLDIGRRHYEYLSKEVEVTGSDNEDLFEITNNADGTMQIRVFIERKNKEDILKFERTFYPSETREVRLFGLRDDDTFIITGAAQNNIRLRIIGGEDDDHIQNDAGRVVYVYDEPEGIIMEGRNFRNRTSLNTEVNDYDRHGFNYNTSLPLLNLGYTKDDKMWIGGAYSWTRHAWRKAPYLSQQKLSLLVAPGSRNAVQFTYDAHFPNLFGKVDFAPIIDFHSPRYENYFGKGNESVNELREIEYNWVRLQTLEVSPFLQISNRRQTSRFRFGPTFETQDIKETEGRVSEDAILGFSEDEIDHRNFLGLKADFETGFADSKVNPTNGWGLHSGLSYLKSLGTEETVMNWDIDMHAYITLLNRPTVVLANKLGFERVLGEPQFYQYPDIGNTTNLRGYRNNRFRGESVFFHNIDLRITLIRSNNNFLPVDIGLLAGYDYGRVWMEDEESDEWHNSQTIGLWFDILGFAVIQPYYSFNPEEDLFSFRLGFNF